MATGTPTFNPPTSAGVTEGGAISGGTANRLLRNDAAGNLDSWDGAVTDSSSRVNFGNGAAVSPSVGSGEIIPCQVYVSVAGNMCGFFTRNESASGFAGYKAESNTGAAIFMKSYAGSAGGAFMSGRNLATCGVIHADGQIQLLSTGANDVVFGANSIEHIELDGSGATGIKESKATTQTTTALAGAAITTTAVAGNGNYVFSALGGSNRTFTFFVTGGVTDGYLMRLTFDGNPGANKVILTPGAGDTINLGATYDLDVTNESVTLMKLGVDWRVVAKGP